jgi:hypothetical protein
MVVGKKKTLRRLGKGTADDPYRFEAVEGSDMNVYDAN